MSDGVFKFEIVVVGAGPGGIAAACAAAESGKRVALLDDTPWLGGQIWRGQQKKSSLPQARMWLERFQQSGATLLAQTSVIAAPRPGVLMAEHPAGAREIHWEQLILATGARELFLPFPGWTLPGVIGPGGLQALVKNGWPIEGQRVVLAGSGPLLLAVADGLRQHGANVISINEQAPWSRLAGFSLKLLSHPGKLLQGAQLKLSLLGIPHRCGVWPVRAEGDDQVRCVTLTDGTKTWTETCDVLACGFGLVPNVELPVALGCARQDDFIKVDQWQRSSVPDIYCVGELTGIGGADAAIVAGQIAGYAASSQRPKAEAWFRERNAGQQFVAALAEAFALRPELKSLATDETFLCRCEDVTLGRVRKFSGWREAKLQTRCGMGACQGRVCGAAAKTILGWDLTSVRPPVLPARVQSLISPTNGQ
jgi:NADPH-dependent 2,4-dienoyl-CoA reductase/sulfur reductase-like enzyme